MDLQFKTFPFEVKAGVNGDSSSFEGLVSVFHNIDSAGEIVADSAFDQDLPSFLEDGFIGGLNHDWDNPIGTPQSAKVVAKGLLLVGNIIDTTHGSDVRKMLKAGVVKKLSIGYRTIGEEMLETTDDVVSYWETKGYMPNAQDVSRAAKGNIRLLTRIKLYEGSPVTVPANSLANITAVKAAGLKALLTCSDGDAATETAPAPATKTVTLPGDERAFERLLRDLGYSQKQAVAITNHGFKSVLPRDAESDETAPEEEQTQDEEPEKAPPADEKPVDVPNPDDSPVSTVTPVTDTQDTLPEDPLAEAVRLASDRVAVARQRAITDLCEKISANLARTTGAELQ